MVTAPCFPRKDTDSLEFRAQKSRTKTLACTVCARSAQLLWLVADQFPADYHFPLLRCESDFGMFCSLLAWWEVKVAPLYFDSSLARNGELWLRCSYVYWSEAVVSVRLNEHLSIESTYLNANCYYARNYRQWREWVDFYYRVCNYTKCLFHRWDQISGILRCTVYFYH